MVKESTVWRSKVCQMGKTATRYDGTHMSAAASAAMWCVCVGKYNRLLFELLNS